VDDAAHLDRQQQALLSRTAEIRVRAAEVLAGARSTMAAGGADRRSRGVTFLRYLAGMAKEVRADPSQLCRLGDQMLTSSEGIDDVWRGNVDTLNIPVAAFGNSNGAPGAHTATVETAGDADVTLSRFVTVLQGDMDRLYRVAFAYQQVDEQNAKNIRDRGPGHAR
jgi:hypothetical protein